MIERLIAQLPGNYPHPICIVQHFPPELTNSFASRLQTLTSLRVVESYEGLEPDGGMVIIARGGAHMGFEQTAGRKIAIKQFAPLRGMRDDFIPSVDIMFESASETFEGRSILAVLLTGIGDDGVEGMVRIASGGGSTVCQNEESCPVFGMPARAIARGVAHAVLSPDEIRAAIIKFGVQ